MKLKDHELDKTSDLIKFFRFTFKSFSFNAAGNGSQKLSCNINFCLKDTECAAETAITGLSCNINEAEKWVVPKGAVVENDLGA